MPILDPDYAPRPFFEAYVLPAVNASRSAPLDKRLAIEALCQIDNLAEHLAHHLGNNARDERQRIAAVEENLQVAWDIHDTHKHGPLHRRNATISHGQAPRIISRGGAIGADAIGAGAIGGGGRSELIVVLDSGEGRFVPYVISCCVTFWESELARQGL